MSTKAMQRAPLLLVATQMCVFAHVCVYLCLCACCVCVCVLGCAVRVCMYVYDSFKLEHGRAD